MPTGALIGALAGPVLGGIATAGVGALGNAIFGGAASKSIDALGKVGGIGINSGGLTSTFKNGNINLSGSAARDALIGRIAATFPDQAAALAQLRAKVAPGAGGLTAAKVLGIQNARRAAIGDLRDNLARRRVLGSSFAQDALTRANLAFGQEEATVRGDAFLQELGLTHELLGAEFTARRGEAQTLVDELNLQSSAAVQLATGATAEAGASARQQAVIAAQSLSGVGSFIEPIASGIGKAVTGALTPKAA